MLERKAMADLVAWKERSSRQGLLVTGARQVGKTTLIREFAARHYDVVVELNFFEQPEAVRCKCIRSILKNSAPRTG